MGTRRKEPSIPYTSHAKLTRSLDHMHGLCPCGQKTVFFKIVDDNEDYVGKPRFEPVARPYDHPAVQWAHCVACNSDVEARALPGSGLYALLRRPRRGPYA